MSHLSRSHTAARRRLLLVFPCFEPGYRFFGEFEPLALEILAAIAREEGIEHIDLIDERWDGDGMERLRRNGLQPDLIAVTSHGYSNIAFVNSAIRRARSLWPEAVIALGGGQATVTPDLFAQNLSCLAAERTQGDSPKQPCPFEGGAVRERFACGAMPCRKPVGVIPGLPSRDRNARRVRA